MGYYLLDYSPYAGTSKAPWYTTRRTCQHGYTKPHLFVIHDPETIEDFQLPDSSAERVARYGASLSTSSPHPASWHWSTDADSAIPMLPISYTGWHVRGYNRCGIGYEIGQKSTSWLKMPAAMLEGTLRLAAGAVRRDADSLGYGTLTQITDAKDAHRVGVIGHYLLDPTRRSDPGATFPWVRFVDYVNRGDTVFDRETEITLQQMADAVKERGSNGWWVGPAIDLVRGARTQPLHLHQTGELHRHPTSADRQVSEQLVRLTEAVEAHPVTPGLPTGVPLWVQLTFLNER